MTEMERIVAWVAGFAAPDCLCGKQAPCPDHGRFIGDDYRPRLHIGAPVNGFALLRAMHDADRYVQKRDEASAS